jgi:CHAT domain-containing protein
MDKYAPLATGLYNILIRPLESYLLDKEMIFIAPDGGLNLVSFAGLVDEDEKYLIESFPIHYLSSGRELNRLRNQSEEGSGLLAIGDPDYDADIASRLRISENVRYIAGGEIEYGPWNYRSGCDYFNSTRLNPLPGTRIEIDAVTAIWQAITEEPAEAFFGNLATEDIFKLEAPGKKVIHLATHGYYMHDQCRSSSAPRRTGSEESAIDENPMLQSGLFFAGANHQGRGADSAGIEDGILTAYEVSALDLSQVKMVVLSACETGLGKVRQGEGVYGLRRAFQIAGVRTIVSALWPITDEATAPLVSGIYGNGDETVPERLRKIQLDKIDQLRSMELADHPYNWAAFIAMGDWQ